MHFLLMKTCLLFHSLYILYSLANTPKRTEDQQKEFYLNEFLKLYKGALSGLRQFSVIEIP